ncbi:MAG: DMT family transporter [Candidatus Nanopelagicales bacterium]|nr:DMT family transporter [Candidatus Nanopelagicales bacterium]
MSQEPDTTHDHHVLGPPDTSAGVPAPPVEEPAATAHARHQRPALGYALYLTAALLFGINGTVSKVVLQAVDDAARVSQLRVTAAFLVLLLVVAVTDRRALRLRRAELGPIAAYGILGVAMTQWLYFVAITRMPIGIALLIEFTAPIMVVLWVRFAWGRPVRDTVWLGLALALLGLAMVAQIWGGLQLDSLGVAAAFGAAVALAVYYLLGEHAGERRDPVSLTLWGFGFAALLWAVALPWWRFPWTALQGGASPLGEGTTTVPLWVLAAWMVVLGTITPFWLVLAAIRHIGAAGASIVGMTEPFIASLIAWVVLGEVLTPVQMIGGVVILAGVVVAERARR